MVREKERRRRKRGEVEVEVEVGVGVGVGIEEEIEIEEREAVVYLLFVILCVLSGGGFCLFLGWGTLDMALVPQFYMGLPFPR